MPLHKTLYAYALTILKDESEAADCLQEAFTKLWEHRHRLDEIGNHAAYAAAIVRNTAVTMAGRQSRRASSYGSELPEVEDISASPGVSVEAKENAATIGKLLAMLPDNQRRVVMMSAINGLSNSEIHEATGLSDDNVRVLLSRGRKKLRDLFSKYK